MAATTLYAVNFLSKASREKHDVTSIRSFKHIHRKEKKAIQQTLPTK